MINPMATESSWPVLGIHATSQHLHVGFVDDVWELGSFHPMINGRVTKQALNNPKQRIWRGRKLNRTDEAFEYYS